MHDQLTYPSSRPAFRAGPGSVPLASALGTGAAVLALFRGLTGQQPGALSSPGETAAWVVSLGIHRRCVAGFGAMARGGVAAARAALGLAPEEFAGWLGTARTAGRRPRAPSWRGAALSVLPFLEGDAHVAG
jgi:hypothetical protein